MADEETLVKVQPPFSNKRRVGKRKFTLLADFNESPEQAEETLKGWLVKIGAGVFLPDGGASCKSRASTESTFDFIIVYR